MLTSCWKELEPDLRIQLLSDESAAMRESAAGVLHVLVAGGSPQLSARVHDEIGSHVAVPCDVLGVGQAATPKMWQLCLEVAAYGHVPWQSAT